MNRLWRALTRNLILKFSALVCAVVLWVYVDGFVPDRKTLLDIVGVDAGAKHYANVLDADGKPTGQSFAIVKVTLQGPSRRVRLASRDDIRGRAKLSDWRVRRKGESTWRSVQELKHEDFTVLAEELRIVDIEPRIIEAVVEEGDSLSRPGVILRSKE